MGAKPRQQLPDWTTLPDELLALIFSKLLLFNDINNFPAVCKAWRSVPQIDSSLGSPFLVTKFVEDSLLRFINPLGKIYHLDGNDIPELNRATIYYTNDGWLLMSRGYSEIFFFHPFTKSIIQLPNVCISNTVFAFTSNPTTNNCMVFGLQHNVYMQFIRMFIISRGEKRWRVIEEYDVDMDYKDPLTCSLNPVYANGKFYYLFQGGGVLVVDPTNHYNESRRIIYPQGKPHYTQCDNYLLDFNGELVGVFVDSVGSAIAVLKLNESNSWWEEIDDLGEYMFFLSGTTCFSRKAVIALMKNKIYFPKFHGKHEVFYCMKEHSFKTFGSKKVDAAKLQLKCAWIEPTKVQSATKSILLDWCENSERKVYEFDDCFSVIDDSTSDDDNNYYDDNDEDEDEDEDDDDLGWPLNFLAMTLNLVIVMVVIWKGVKYFFLCL